MQKNQSWGWLVLWPKLLAEEEQRGPTPAGEIYPDDGRELRAPQCIACVWFQPRLTPQHPTYLCNHRHV